MVKPELGTKRVCVSCGTRFYDLTKSPAVCPKCGTEQPIEQPRLRRASGNVAAEDKRVKKPVPVAEEEDDAVESADELDDDEAIDGDIAVENDREEET